MQIFISSSHLISELKLSPNLRCRLLDEACECGCGADGKGFKGRTRLGGRGEGCNGEMIGSGFVSSWNTAGGARTGGLRTTSAQTCGVWLPLAPAVEGLCASTLCVTLCSRLSGDEARLPLLRLSSCLFPLCMTTCHHISKTSSTRRVGAYARAYLACNSREQEEWMHQGIPD